MENQKIHIEAIEEIPRYACVTSSGGLADSNDAASENNIIGVTEGRIASGEWGDATIAGILFNQDWSWVKGSPIYLNGIVLSQNPPGTGFVQQMGWALTSESILINVQSAGTTAPLSLGVPTGAILMWSGTLAQVPTGWALCDGTNGTPDLRDRFVRGASTGMNPGTIAGSNTHSHNDHVFTPSGTVSQPTFTGDEQTFTTVPEGTGDSTAMSTPNPYTPSGTVSQPTFTGVQETLTHSTANNVPVYYAVAFIMKL